ncbi:hypothetical protein EJB05_51243 [Eragrostis curvula]|uniref:Uncharacterized protein n=1 Tax=Eragrostis curvula TaxID=38414 RepID=A0A5J9SW77_9POAL|nr:hypothetical protein EJB05_51243 [Eragrostis curvula]
MSSLKMVTAYSDGQVKAEFQNITDPISRLESQHALCIDSMESKKRLVLQLAFNSDSPHFNSCKIWEFEEAHQRWLPLVELGSPNDMGDRVCDVAWAPNIGRPYEIIAVATCKAIAIWYVGLNSDGGPSTENVAVLSGHDGEVWQLEWDMGGMTLASTGSDGVVKLWQANLDGVWHEQAVLDCTGSHN